MEREVHPNRGTNELENRFNDLKKKELPRPIYTLIHDLLKEFMYEPGKVHDVSSHILNGDIDSALEDCVPMKVFFGMCANNFEEKEEWIDEKIKNMIDTGVVNGSDDDKITIKKGRIKTDPRYLQMVARRVRYRKLKKHCRVLEQAMEMRRDITQSKSANYRFGLSGPYVNK